MKVVTVARVMLEAHIVLENQKLGVVPQGTVQQDGRGPRPEDFRDITVPTAVVELVPLWFGCDQFAVDDRRRCADGRELRQGRHAQARLWIPLHTKQQTQST